MKVRRILLVCVLALVFVLALTACTINLVTESKPDAHNVHTPVTDKAVAPTCTATGLTEGMHCAECGDILVKQEIIPMSSEHTYDDEYDAVCNVCGYKKDIESNETRPEDLFVVLPDGNNFEKLTIDATYPSEVQEGYRADGGFVFRMSVSGKSSGLVVMCGIDSEGKIVGTKVIANQETPEYAAKVFPNVEGLEGAYTGMGIENFQPYLVSKATLTSEAYGKAIKAALQAFAIANGGSVDLRTPEQILQNNCNAALGTTDIKFTKWFATEVLEGVDAVYEAADNSGRVYVIGESFAGVKTDGTIVDLGGADEAVIKAADNTVKSSVPTEVTELPDGINKTIIKKIYVTESGNYVFELQAKGYACLNSYYTTDIPISIKLSISADGKIIDCLTVSHAESTGIGDKCATEEYYEQYRDHSNEDIVITVPNPDFYQTQTPESCTDIGAIAGASYSATAYQKAVKAAFAAYELLIAKT